MIEYRIYNSKCSELSISDGFFEHWITHPSKDKHREILINSYKAIVAIDNNTIIGFINIISDGILSAYIPLLEVIPSYRNMGIGKKLVRLALKELENIYMIDLSCDDNLVEFYKKLGMHKTNALFVRNYKAQSG